VERVLADPSFARQSHEMKAALARYGGPDYATGQIENMLAGKGALAEL
jgi:UDP:flavonoid glycosyltransferase YjiC (YdhE family)